jgi:hypothetical protein
MPDYTRAERRAIDTAYSAVSYIVDHMGHSQPSALRDALRLERRGRSSATVAKALLVRGFVDGRRRNPRAAELATISAGIATAAMIGADSRGREYLPADTLRRLPALARAAAAAHDASITRGFTIAETIGG